MSAPAVALSEPSATKTTVKKEPKENKMNSKDLLGREYNWETTPQSITVLEESTQEWFAKVVHKTVKSRSDYFEPIYPKNNRLNIGKMELVTTEEFGLGPNKVRDVLRVRFVFDKVWVTDGTGKNITRELPLYPNATTSFGITPETYDAHFKSQHEVVFELYRD